MLGILQSEGREDFRRPGLRASSFAVSCALHIAFLVSVPYLSKSIPAPILRAREPSIFDGHKVIYYSLKKKPREVSPETRPASPKPLQGENLSRKTVIASSPKPVSTRQLIWLPDAPVTLKEDLQVPDIISRVAAPPPKPVKAFKEPPLLPSPKPVLAAEVPTTPSTGTAAVGNGPVDLAVASLWPRDVPPGDIPGSREGRFSKAPRLGPPSEGGGTGTDVVVPNLTVRDEPPPPPALPPPPPSKPAVIYTEKVRAANISSLSVPLRASSGFVPRMVQSVFLARSVYTLVIPIENLPEYQGDWILWFSQREPQPGVVRAPVPFRKLQAGSPPAVNRRVQIKAAILKTGKIDAISLLNGVTAPQNDPFLSDISSWEFKPATRNNEPIDVDVVLEVTFAAPVSAQR